MNLGNAATWLDSDNEHPSEIDEQDSAEELEEWPQELNAVYSPAADDGAMAARLTKGTKVARFFHGEGWCVGHNTSSGSRLA